MLGKGLDGAGEEDRSELRPREAVACGIINPISEEARTNSVLGFGWETRLAVHLFPILLMCEFQKGSRAPEGSDTFPQCCGLHQPGWALLPENHRGLQGLGDAEHVALISCLLPGLWP